MLSFLQFIREDRAWNDVDEFKKLGMENADDNPDYIHEPSTDRRPGTMHHGHPIGSVRSFKGHLGTVVAHGEKGMVDFQKHNYQDSLGSKHGPMLVHHTELDVPNRQRN